MPGTGDSDTAEVSDDGRFVAFRSRAANLVPGDTNLAWDVFLRDRQARQTRRLNLRFGFNQSPFPIDTPQISMTPDGRYIAYASADSMIAPAPFDDTNGVLDVFVYDMWNGQTHRVDVGSGTRHPRARQRTHVVADAQRRWTVCLGGVGGDQRRNAAADRIRPRLRRRPHDAAGHTRERAAGWRRSRPGRGAAQHLG